MGALLCSVAPHIMISQDIIYDFVLAASKSTIPNAGNGVFLTFLGARELKPSRRRRGRELIADRPAKEPNLSFPIDAIHPDGFGITVTITGEHLHCPYNSLCLLPSLKALVLDSTGNERQMKVRFSDPELPYYEEELAAFRDPTEKIGLLGIYTEADYVPAPKRTFSSQNRKCGYIDIGRYGPFRKSGK